jgi:hypothetical protein
MSGLDETKRKGVRQMKKLLAIICLVMLFSVATTPVATVDEAQAMASLGCTTAMDFGWSHWGWNMICYYELISIPPDDGWDGDNGW